MKVTNYLEIDTIDNNGNEFMHFLSLKSDFLKDLKYLVFHLEHFKGQIVTKTVYRDTRLTNW